MSATRQRLEELSKELEFLDICELLLRFQAKTDMNVSWKHPGGVSVTVKQPRKKRDKGKP